MGGTVYILGSGFSKALASDDLPVVAELRSDVAQYVKEQRPQLLIDTTLMIPDVEALLTHLATEQPFLDAAENAANRALFLQLANWLAYTIFNKQQHALGSPRTDDG